MLQLAFGLDALSSGLITFAGVPQTACPLTLNHSVLFKVVDALRVSEGANAGMHKVTGDMTQIAAQIPALFETLSGMNMADLLGKVKTLGNGVSGTKTKV